MIKVMVVEDEPPILRSISKAIETASPLCKVTETAYNGEQALTLLADTEIDVIFTDINMPVMDGIALCRYVSEHMPHIRTVILSGYQEFAYAQQALRYHAADYLIKPINAAKLVDLLEKLTAEVEKERRENNSRLIQSAVYHNTDISGCSLAPKDSLYYITLFYAGSYPLTGFNCLSYGYSFWNQADLSSELPTSFFQQEFTWVINGKNDSEKILIFSAPDADYASDAIHALYEKLAGRQGVPVTCITSQPFPSLKNVNSTIRNLQGIIRKRLVFGESGILMPNSSSSLLYSTTSDFENKLIFLLGLKKYREFSEEMVSLINGFEKSPITQYNLEIVLDGMMLIIKKHSPHTDFSGLKYSISEAISNSIAYRELSAQLYEILLSFFQADAFVQTDDKTKLLAAIDQYILENITEPITNQTLSAKFGLVSSYISRLFKSYKGLSPSDYIQQIRIEKAKELLKDEELKVKDISFLVGYPDPFHFSRVFKNATGYSPSQYREQGVMG